MVRRSETTPTACALPCYQVFHRLQEGDLGSFIPAGNGTEPSKNRKNKTADSGSLKSAAAWLRGFMTVFTGFYQNAWKTAWATEKSVIILDDYCILPKPGGRLPTGQILSHVCLSLLSGRSLSRPRNRTSVTKQRVPIATSLPTVDDRASNAAVQSNQHLFQLLRLHILRSGKRQAVAQAIDAINRHFNIANTGSCCPCSNC